MIQQGQFGCDDDGPGRPTEGNSKYFDDRLHHEPWTEYDQGKRFLDACQGTLDEHVDATKVGAYCASWNGSFVFLPKTLDGGQT